MLENKLTKLFRNTIINTSMLFLLGGCGNAITNNSYQPDSKEDLKTEDVYQRTDSQIDFYEDNSINNDTEDVSPDLTVDTVLVDLVDVQEVSEPIEDVLVEVTDPPKDFHQLSISDNYECANLSSFPQAFQTEGVFNGYAIIGEYSGVDENLALTYLLSGMKYLNSNGVPTFVEVNNGSTKLDSEISDLEAQNIIAIGSPCVNSVTAELWNNPPNCVSGLVAGKTRVMMLKSKNTGNLAMVLTGYSGLDTKTAGKVLGDNPFLLSEINDCEAEISGTYDSPVVGPGLISFNDPQLGDAGAPVTIVEFGGYQCPYTKQFHDDILHLVKQDYIDQGLVYFVFKDLPFDFHPNSTEAAEAAECAKDQNAFWDYHHSLFAKQGSLDSEMFVELADSLGLNVEQFSQCYSSGDKEALINVDFEAAMQYGVNGTPTFMINGIKHDGAMNYNLFKSIIDPLIVTVEPVDEE